LFLKTNRLIKKTETCVALIRGILLLRYNWKLEAFTMSIQVTVLWIVTPFSDVL